MHSINKISKPFSFSSEIDSSFLSDYCDGDLSFCNDMFEAFLSTCREDIIELYQAIKNKDYNSIAQIAHKIKPNYAFVGLSSASSILSNIEQNAKDGTISEDAEKMISDIKSYIDIAERESIRLKQYLESNN